MHDPSCEKDKVGSEHDMYVAAPYGIRMNVTLLSDRGTVTGQLGKIDLQATIWASVMTE